MVAMTPASHRSDDEQLWAGWVDTHGRAVRGYVLAMVRCPGAADDLAQEVFVRAWQARGRYREEGNARAYLLRIADRLVCDRARKRGREVHVSDEQWRQVEPAYPSGEPDGEATQDAAIGQLAAAMESLSPPQQRVLLLRYYGELSFAEIAAIMQCPVGTALSHCHRGLQALRKQLVENEP
jgi:RNA polymerase sigma-70 factor (ECF subfamily)